MSDPIETELKFDCDLEALKAASAHPRLKEAVRRPAAKLRSVYFDTADRKLRKAGLVLRVRTARGRCVQTVKADGDGLFSRPEWESVVAGPDPDRGALEGSPAAALVRDEALEPLFAVEVRRRVFVMRENGSEIELAFDDGRIVAQTGAASSAICELELELKAGAPADLFALARALGEAGEFRIGVRSKSERGFALVDGAEVAPEHADTPRLAKGASAADAFRIVAHGCLRQIRLNEAILLDRPDAEALHQLRVGVRRLRSAISLFGDMVDDPVSERLSAELKSLTEPFGLGRNLDVFLAETLPQERDRRPDEAGLLNLEKQFETERAKAHQAIADRLRSPEWRLLLLDFLAWINVGPWLSPQDKTAKKALGKSARKFAEKSLDRRRRQVKKRGRDFDSLSAEDRHKVRIAAKKLRYGAQFFADLFADSKRNGRQKSFVKALKRLQNRLGALNDIATGQELMADAAAHRLKGPSSVYAAGLTAGDLESGGPQLVSEARDAYDALMDEKPFWR